MINRSPTYLELPVNVPSKRKQRIREISLENFVSGCLHKLLEYFQPHKCPAPLQQYGRPLLLRLKRLTHFAGDESTSGALQQLPARQLQIRGAVQVRARQL